MNNQYPSYFKNRKCKFCSKPIADHTHALTQFCEKEDLPDGNIKCCKDRYHTERRRINNQHYQNICNHHKQTTENIGLLLNQKGDIVTADHLDQYHVRLDRSVQFEFPATQQGVWYFVEYSIAKTNEKEFKISTHERDFQ